MAIFAAFGIANFINLLFIERDKRGLVVEEDRESFESHNLIDKTVEATK
jgi:hypothetical protein